MSMSAERDDELEDELLRRVVAELRRPVRLDPAVDLRAMRAIRQEAAGGRPVRPRVRPAVLASAALAAGLLVAVLLRPESATGPSAPVTITAAPEVGTRPVSLRLAAPASSRVAVVGDFNDWDPSGTPLRPGGSPGLWTDGRRWEGDPSEPRAPETDFGVPVSVLTVS